MSECHRKKLRTTKIKRSGLSFIQVDRDTIINNIRQKERKEGIEKFVSGSDSQKEKKKKKNGSMQRLTTFRFDLFVSRTHNPTRRKWVALPSEQASKRQKNFNRVTRVVQPTGIKNPAVN